MKMTTTSTTSVNGKSTPTLKATLSTSNSSSNSATPAALPQKPKLTGWAQAAAKALPKQQQQQQPKKDDSGAAARPANGKSKVIVSAAPSTHTKGSSTTNGSSTNKKLKRANRQPYNRDEVRSYMHKLFQSYTTGEMSHSTKTYKQVLSETASGRVSTATDWGTVSSSKNRNKKYGCLTDIAKVLRSQ